MVHLTMVSGVFQARVVAARLGADGILVQLRGDWGSTYPVGGPVEILVESDRLEMAKKLLQADEEARRAAVEEPVREGGVGEGPVGGAGRLGGAGRRLALGWWWLAVAWLVVGVLVALYLLSMLG
jgi:hypothetical protein